MKHLNKLYCVFITVFQLQVGSKKLQDGMDQNSSLIHLDLRFTGSSQEAEYAISQRIEMNQAMNYKLQVS